MYYTFFYPSWNISSFCQYIRYGEYGKNCGTIHGRRVEHRRSAMASDEARNADILRTFGTINLGEL